MSNSALVSQTTARRNSVGIRFGVVRVVAVALTMLAALDADAVVRFPARIPRVPRAPTRVPHAPVIPAGLIDWERRNGPRWPNQTPNKENKDEWVRGRVLIRTNECLGSQYEQLEIGRIYNSNYNLEVAEKYVWYLDNANKPSDLLADECPALGQAHREGRYSSNSDRDEAFNGVFAGCHPWGSVGKVAAVILLLGCSYLVFKRCVLKVFKFLGNVHARLTNDGARVVIVIICVWTAMFALAFLIKLGCDIFCER